MFVIIYTVVFSFFLNVFDFNIFFIVFDIDMVLYDISSKICTSLSLSERFNGKSKHAVKMRKNSFHQKMSLKLI